MTRPKVCYYARWERTFTKDDLKATANMAFSGLYDYERNAVYKGVFRNRQPPKRPVFGVYSPRFGCLIGKYMSDEAYEKFMSKQVELWDERLAEGRLGRVDTYSMPFDVLEARLNRYGPDSWLELE